MEDIILTSAYAYAQQLMPFGEFEVKQQAKVFPAVWENRKIHSKLKRINHCYSDQELEAVLPLSITDRTRLSTVMADELFNQPRPPVANRKPWVKLSLSARRKILGEFISALPLPPDAKDTLRKRKDIVDCMPLGLQWDKTNAIIDGIQLTN